MGKTSPRQDVLSKKQYKKSIKYQKNKGVNSNIDGNYFLKITEANEKNNYIFNFMCYFDVNI